jgi:hypothetical protein
MSRPHNPDRADVLAPTPAWRYYPQAIRSLIGRDTKQPPDLRNNRVPTEWATQPKGACYGQPHS